MNRWFRRFTYVHGIDDQSTRLAWSVTANTRLQSTSLKAKSRVWRIDFTDLFEASDIDFTELSEASVHIIFPHDWGVNLFRNKFQSTYESSEDVPVGALLLILANQVSGSFLHLYFRGGV